MNLTHVSLDRKESAILGLISQMVDQVDSALDQALQALIRGDKELAQQIVNDDQIVNDLCQQVEEAVFATIIRFQPVAADLRQLNADAYVAAELERIGDYAAGIAKLALQGGNGLPQDTIASLEELSRKSRTMLGNVVEAYLAQNETEARAVAAKDDEIDQLESTFLKQCKEQLKQGGGAAIAYAGAMVIAHNYERIGDRATNIAERTVFLMSGDRVGLND